MTAQTLPAALSAFAAVVGGVSGVEKSPAFALFNVNNKVFALNYVMTSVVEISETGTKQNLALFASDILTPFEQVANDDLEFILTLADSILTALIQEATSGGDMFSGTIDTYTNARLEFLPNYVYGGIQYIGYRIMLEDVKLKLDL